MKILTGTLAVILPLMANAQGYTDMGEGDMQNMMLQMQKMQTCMQGVDQARLQEFEQRAKMTEAEVNSLCASGKRDNAQQKAMEFGREVANDADMQKIVECGKMMSGAMPVMPYMEQASAPDSSDRHVCDQ